MSGETEANESGWTVDTLRYYNDAQGEALAQRLIDLRTLLDERYQTQTKATDAAFAAQQKAMETAFTAAALAVQTALESAEKAVAKAEAAAEKRFEATNEFRGQLADQANTFVGKAEFLAVKQRVDEQMADMKTRMDKAEGGRTALIAGILAMASIAAIVGVVLGVMVR